MLQPRTQRRVAVLAFLTLPVVAFGHHARFTYDDSRLVEIQGTVGSVFWRNPHIRFMVSHMNERSEEELWEVEGGPVNALERRGIDSDSIAVGDRVTVLGLASRRDEFNMLPVHVTRGSGELLVLSAERAREFGLPEVGTAPIRPPVSDEQLERAIGEADGIFRVWTNTGRTQTRSTLPLREAARIAKDSWDQPTDDLALRCVQAGMPEAMVSPFPIEFIDDGDRIIVRLEEWDNVRTIYMSGDAAPENPPATHLGYSVGHWDGAELVVETSGITYPYLDDRGTPQSDAVEIVERFTMSEDESRMDWLATLVDLNTFTEPFTLPIMHWEWRPGVQIKPYNCTLNDEG